MAMLSVFSLLSIVFPRMQTMWRMQLSWFHVRSGWLLAKTLLTIFVNVCALQCILNSVGGAGLQERPQRLYNDSVFAVGGSIFTTRQEGGPGR